MAGKSCVSFQPSLRRIDVKASKRMLFFFLAPVLLAYAFAFIYPIAQTILFSFFDVSQFIGGEMKFVGLDNFIRLAQNPIFLKTLQVMLGVWVFNTLGNIGLAMLFTVLLTSGIRGKSFFRSVIYLPNIVSAVAISAMWTLYILNPQYGLFKNIFDLVGLSFLANIPWLSSNWIFWAMIIAMIWASTGWFLLIYLAAAERIPTEYYESARLDGANMWQIFMIITLPLMRDVLRMTVVMQTIGSINLFTFPMVFGGKAAGSVSPEISTPAIYMYEKAFGVNVGGAASTPLGVASAVAVFLVILVLVMYFVITRLFGQERYEY
jgi:ABC-type sugar transport system permease subunit